MRFSPWPIVAFALLAGCTKPVKPDDRICLTPGNVLEQGDWKTCVHRWAYRLAGAPDPSRDIAKAVVAGCADAIAMALETERAASVAAPQPMTDRMREAEDLAFFHVVQAKAGHCEVP